MISTLFNSAVVILAALSLFSNTTRAQHKPTVVFESGLGDGAKVWRKTIDAMPRTITVFTYDRPGYGKMPQATTPRDPCTIATELRAKLSAAGHSPPYVLVGHSLGGQYVYAFARLYPQDVAGLILVDATPPGHWQTMQSELPAAASLLRLMKATMFSKTMRREFDAQEQCLAGLAQTPLPFPAHVLVGTRPDPAGGEKLLEIDHSLAGAWLRMTGATAIEPVVGSGHYIQRDQPKVLADTIIAILSTAGAERGYTPHVTSSSK